MWEWSFPNLSYYPDIFPIVTTLRGGRSGDRIPVGARFSASVQTVPGAHPAFCTMGTVSFPGVKSGWGMTLTLHPLLMPRSRKSRAIPLLPLWAVRPVQSLSACTRVHFTFTILTFSRGLDKIAKHHTPIVSLPDNI